MTLPVTLVGPCTGTANLNAVAITSQGALVVAPFAYDETSFNELGVAGTAANYYLPKVDKRFVITGIIATADKQVGTNEDAVVTVFEASNATTSTQDKVLITFVLTQSQVVSFLPLNIRVNEGKFVNGETDNDDIHMNIMGYYIPASL